MAIEFVIILYNWSFGCLVIKVFNPCLKIKGARTNITSTHLKKVISKTWISSDKYLAALCITMKLNPDIIIKMMEIDVDEQLLKYFKKFFNEVITI